ncbi:MAG: fibronectin type III domain-containing protein [Acidobacteriia bacterium]|nr:fibronectin type III domain-containing protein [Terriglobia bacterium]
MRKPTARLTIGIALIFSLGVCVPAFAGSAMLTWNANTDAVAGYNVYFGTASRTYGTPIDVGNQTTYTINSLNPGTYFFAVKAYNSGRTESGFSNEVAKLITAGTPSSHCDINADTATNALDLQAVINAILAGTNLVNGDINTDAKVDVLDLQILNNVILGARSCP